MIEVTHNVELETYSYKDFKEGFEIQNDPYDIGGYAKTPARHKAFIECPFVKDESFIMLCLARIDGVIGGRIMFFPELFKAGDEFIEANGGSTLLVHEEYRKTDTAVDIVMYPIRNKLSDAIIYADFSKEGIGVYKALRFNIFSLNKMMLAFNSRFFYENLGLKGGLLKIFTNATNLFIHPLIKLLKLTYPSRLNQIVASETKVVPEWVDEIVLNDGHKYMEVHDHRWLQWCLDNKFHDDSGNVNKFFTLQKDGEPLGFFMIKERFGGIASRGISPMLVGTVVEWGSKDLNILSEFDIIRIALGYFSKGIDMIQIFSDDEVVLKKARRHGFIHHGSHFIVFRDMTKRFKDAKDQKLWRLRFGYSDSIMN